MDEQYKSPPKGTIFDFYVIKDPDNPRFEEWQKKLKIIEYHHGENISYIAVPIIETVSSSELTENLLDDGLLSLLIGMVGWRKTYIADGMLESNRK